MTYRFSQFATVVFFLGASLPLSASLIATSTATYSLTAPATYHYSLVLNDTGTTNVGTFWFSWTPGQDYMPATPVNITNPSGWTSSITGSGAADGRAIRWVAGAGSALTPGQSLGGFSFDSATTPAQMAGLNTFFANTLPVTTTVVYSGAPFSDAGFTFTAAVAPADVPEPSGIALGMLGIAALAGLRRIY